MSILLPLITPTTSLQAPDAFVLALPSGFTRIAYQREPWRVLWCVRSDGVLCGLTYRREQDVWAWHRHPRKGKVRDIAVIPSPMGTHDEVWLVVEREIGGQTKLLMEIMTVPDESSSSSSVWGEPYLESILTYRGPPATVFSGLDHLEGETVTVVADGIELPMATISMGQLSITDAASVVHVGLPIRALIDVRPLSRQVSVGVLEARRRGTTRLHVQVRNTMGGRVGRSESKTDPLTDRQTEDRFDRPPIPRTGMIGVDLDQGWDVEGRVVVLTTQSYPLNIEALLLETTVPNR